MKKMWVLILLVAAIFIGFYWKSPNPALMNSKSTGGAIQEPTVSPKSSFASNPKQKPPAPALPRVSTPLEAKFGRNENQLPPGFIQFRTKKIGKETLAVAYGDAVLGSPPPGFDGPQGVTEIPRPRTWDQPEIAYSIDAAVVRPERIGAALEWFHAASGVRFVPLEQWESPPSEGIVFTVTDEHCYSYLGRMGGWQPIYLSSECQPKEIAHEVLHALGFVHEQSRADRDQYVEIVWDAIDPKFRDQFEKVPEEWMQIYGDSPWDPSSLLMYDPKALVIQPELVSMRLKSGEPLKRISAMELPAIDVQRLQRLYR